MNGNRVERRVQMAQSGLFTRPIFSFVSHGSSQLLTAHCTLGAQSLSRDREAPVIICQHLSLFLLGHDFFFSLSHSIPHHPQLHPLMFKTNPASCL